MDLLLGSDVVWYVCYGSNLLQKRFFCYIRGGMMPVQTKFKMGAKDKTLPKAVEPHILENAMFVGSSTPEWGSSGVMFLDPHPAKKARTYGRRYLITVDQFKDVLRQEHSLPMTASILIDDKELAENGSTVVFPDSAYGRLLYLGKLGDVPLVTFTHVENAVKVPDAALSGNYYDTLFQGIKEVYDYDDAQISAYLDPFAKI